LNHELQHFNAEFKDQDKPYKTATYSWLRYNGPPSIYIYLTDYQDLNAKPAL